MNKNSKTVNQPLGPSITLENYQGEKPLARILKATPFFYELTQEEFDGVAKDIKIYTLESEKTIIREGEMGGSLYFVVAGQLRVVIRKGNSSKKILLGKLNAGDFFGEHSLLTGSFRTATVITISPSELLEIPRDIYNKFAMKYQGIQSFLVDLCSKYQEKTAKVVKNLHLTRRRSNRFDLVGKVKLKEQDGAELIKTGSVINLSKGGIAFNVPKNQVNKDREKLIGIKYLVELKLAGLITPVKFLGEVISCEVGMHHRELANFYIVRMKFVGVDKNGKPLLVDFLNKLEAGAGA